jgi:uncharacterized LabA/DUF88 family protein
MIKHKDQRVAVFVDAQNVYHSAKNLFNANANFEKILEAAVAGRVLVRALVYGITSPGADEEKFFEALDKQGFELRLKDLQIFSGGAKKGDWDVGVAIDAIRIADKVDSVVLVTGDGDFVPLVEYLQINKGCLVEAVSFARSTSSKLIESVDDFLDLGENENTFLIRFRKKTPRKAPQRKK